MYSYEEKMRAVELYLKYGLSAAAVINELEQHIKKNKLLQKISELFSLITTILWSL